MPDCPAQGGVGRLGTVDADHNPADLFWGGVGHYAHPSFCSGLAA
jgi:hypothetical protein